MDDTLDLSGFSPEEVEQLKDVIRRDKALQKREESRLERLEKQLQSIWKPGNFNSDEQCFYCGDTFNIVFSPRNTCSNCLKEMCRKCMLEYKKQSYKLCKSCDAKNCFILKSGEWKTQFSNKRDRGASRIGLVHRSASDILSVSIRRQRHAKVETPKTAAVSSTPSVTVVSNAVAKIPEEIQNPGPSNELHITPQPPIKENRPRLPREPLNPPNTGVAVTPKTPQQIPTPSPRRSAEEVTKVNENTVADNGSSISVATPSRIPHLSKLETPRSSLSRRSAQQVTKVSENTAPENVSKTPVTSNQETPTTSAPATAGALVSNETKPSLLSVSPRKSIDKSGNAIEKPRVKIAEAEPIIIPDSKLYSPPSSDVDDGILIPTFEERIIPAITVNGDSGDGGSNNVARQKLMHTGSLLSVYSETEESYGHNIPISGEIIFGMVYHNDLHLLIITIEGVKNMAEQSKESTDLYVKTYLLPDKTQTSKRKTSIKRHSSNLVFNEKLEYFFSEALLRSRTLSVALWGRYKFQHNICLGEVQIPLAEWDFTTKPAMSYPLQKKEKAPPAPANVPTSIIYKGDLVFALKYTTPNAVSDQTGVSKVPSPGELQVWIREAKNLLVDQGSAKPDTFAKIYLLPDQSNKGKRKTQVIRRSHNPQWNAMVRFSPISVAELKGRCLEISLWNYGRFKTNEFLGGLRLNCGTRVLPSGENAPWNPARGPAVTIWESMLEKPDIWIDGALLLQPNID